MVSETSSSDSDSSSAIDFPVVGIGASAGGLAALERFFDALPDKPREAFVVVMHLDPEHESNLGPLLQRHTPLPTTQVTGRTPIKAGHVYVIPPGRALSVEGGHLALSDFEEARGRRAPIDFFFRSLARLGDRAVGAILSGSGSDGSVGIKAIKEEGGLALAQSPEEAEYDAMPRHAIETGLVDITGPAAELAERLAEYEKNRRQIRLPERPEGLEAEEKEALHEVTTQLRLRTGHDFSGYKRSTLLRRIGRRMQVNQIKRLRDYLEIIRSSEDEADLLLKDLLISVTNFFRDPESWEALKKKVIPELFEGKTHQDQVRVWAVGCATGEEAYSLAILLLEHARALEDPPGVQVFATDLDEEALWRAREGVYPEAVVGDLPVGYLRRYFLRKGDRVHIKKEVRDRVLFAPHNMLGDPPFSKLDLVSCRNLLIYLERDMQPQVFQVFHYALRPGGYLFLGSAESAEETDLFRTVDKKQHVYQKAEGRRVPPSMPSLSVVRSPRGGKRPPAQEEKQPQRRQKAPLEAHQRLLEEQAPPSVVVDEQYDIVHLSEQAGRYLRHQAGEPTNSIVRLVREELRRDLRAALHQAFHHGQPTSTRPVSVAFNGASSLLVHLIVRPGGGDGEEPLALVLFAEVAEAAMQTGKGEEKKDAQVRLLEQELQTMQERLQETVEEYETSKEEMKAANEELQSINEEYKSTNEELETSREELQSVNEELETVNAELERKVEELSTANDDLKNLMASMDAGTLFLDRDLQIKRYTPQVEELFNLKPTDLGRPISDLRQRLDYDELEEDARAVLRTEAVSEREVWDDEERCFLARHRPYRTTDEHSEGVVITFVEITGRKAAEEELRQTNVSLKKRTEEVRRLAADLTLAEQYERRRIGFILHDHIQQLLFAMGMEVRDLRDELCGDKKEALSNLESILDEVIEDTRTLSVELSPPVAESEGGLDVVLEWLALHVKQRYGLAVELQVEEGVEVKNDELATFLFQVLRELLFNVVKHAEVDRARLAVRSEGEKLIFVVSDDGAGFDAKELEKREAGHHMGLRGLERRLGLIGGALKVESRPGEGTEVTLTIPKKVREEF